MNLRRFLPRFAVGLLGFASLSFAHASTFSTSGHFTTDDGVYTYDFSTSTDQTYDFNTTSFAAGGFDPVLTLFNGAGNPVDNSGPGAGDASMTDTLGAGNYILTLTEFPNVAVGTYSQGFLFAGDPTITGDTCGMSGSMFVDDISCTQRSSLYSLNVTSSPAVAATPEPASWLLVLPGVAAIAYTSRRRRLA